VCCFGTSALSSFFFEDYHDDLIHVLKIAASPNGAVVYSMAPSRGGSLERFVKKFTAATTDNTDYQRHVQVIVSLDYDTIVTQKHQQFIDTDTHYDPSIHMPQLVQLQFPSNVQ
jgi:hypothetical protein